MSFERGEGDIAGEELDEEVALKQRQARHGAAGQEARQSMIRMRLVVQRGLDVSELEGLVEGGRGGFETARQLIGLVCNVIAVEGVEPDVTIALLCEERLPCRPRRRQRVR